MRNGRVKDLIAEAADIGFTADDLHATAKEIRDEHNRLAAEYNGVHDELLDYGELRKRRRSIRSERAGFEDEAVGSDEAGYRLSSAYPEHIRAGEEPDEAAMRIIREGRRPAMGEREAYQQALERLSEVAHDRALHEARSEHTPAEIEETLRGADEAATDEAGAGEGADPGDFAFGANEPAEPPAGQRPAAGEPAPPAGEPDGLTSARKEWMARDRAALGLDELPGPQRQSWEQALTSARDAGIPERALRIAASVNEKPRSLTVEETAGLVQKAAALKNEHASLLRDVHESDDPAAIRDKRAELARVESEFGQLSAALKKSGTKKGQELASQKLTINEDYDLVSVVSRAKAAKGESLTPEERAGFEKLTADLTAAQARVRELEQKSAERRTDETVNGLKAEVRSEPKPRAPTKGLAERVVLALEREAEKSRAALRDMSGRLFAGVDPEPVVHLAKIAAAKIARGGYELAKFTADMVGEFGEKVRPYLGRAWQQAEQLVRQHGAVERLRTTGMEAGRPLIARAARQLAKEFVRGGETEREPLIDKVHSVLRDIIPDITREQTTDAISGYGDYKPLSKEQTEVTLRDLKGQMQQLGKLRDLEARLAPKKSGVERRTPSDEERALIKQVNDLRKELGVAVTDPETQLKSTLDGIKTRLRNEIADLDRQIASGQKLDRNRNPVRYDEEATRLREARDAKKAEFDDVFGKPELTDAQRIERAGKALDKSIAALEGQLQRGELYPGRPESKTPASPELDARRSRLEELRTQRDELRAADTPHILAQKEARIKSQVAELEDRLARGDFARPAKRPAGPTNDAIEGAAAQRERLKRQIDHEVQRLAERNKPRWAKLMDTGLAVQRAGMLSGVGTLEKLGGAGALRMIFAPVREAIGGAWGLVPGVRQIAARAPREGGFSPRAEIDAAAATLTKGFASAYERSPLGQGASKTDLLYGQDKYPREPGVVGRVLGAPGETHNAIKAFPFENEFARATTKRTDFYARNGLDVNRPDVRERIRQEAARDADRAVFMQDNRVVDWFNGLVARLRAPDPATGQPRFGSYLGASAVKSRLPIVRVPTNIIVEAGRHIFGLVTGSAQAAGALARGLDKLTPGDADLIMRRLKDGTLGGAAVAIGWAAYGSLGGLHVSGAKHPGAGEELQSGEMSLGGYKVPKELTHLPLLMALQFGATMHRDFDERVLKGGDRMESAAWAAGTALGALVRDVPFVRETEETNKLLNPRSLPTATGEMVRAFAVPQLIQEIARALDKDPWGNPVKRKPHTFGESLKSGVPGLRDTVPTR